MENKNPKKKAVKKVVAKQKTVLNKKAPIKKIVKKAGVKTKKVAAKKTSLPKPGAIKEKKITAILAGIPPVPEKLRASQIRAEEPSPTPPSDRAPASRPVTDLKSSDWQEHYGDDRMVLMVRDPNWCFVYWDMSAEKQADMIRESQHAGAKIMLRIYDVTDINFDGSNAHRSMDVEINADVKNWYINVWAADRSYCVDMGLLYPDGRFKTLVRSNVVTTPRDSISPVVDEEWMVVDETFDRLYQTAGASEVGCSSEAITKYMLKRVRAEGSSEGLASMGSEGGRPAAAKPEDFWLVVNTELIVYGATLPEAQVTIQEQAIKLNSDGSFSVRYALPDGKQAITVKAVDSAGSQERQITPIIEKTTA